MGEHMKKNKKEKKNIKGIGSNLQNRDLQKSKFEDSFIYWLVLVVLWGLVFFPPYFRGLFFNTEQNIALIFAVAAFSVWWFMKVKDDGLDILNNPLDWFVVGLLASYIIAFFGAVNQKLAVVEVIKHLLYFNVFWLASRLFAGYKTSVSLINVIILSAVGVALAGMFTAVDWLYIKDGFVNNRIYSTLQYPNTLASYLLAVAILTLGLWQVSGKNFRYVYILLAYIMMVVFFGTNSRGAFLLLPLVVILTLANPWLKNKIESLLFWFLLLVSSLAASTGFINNVADEKTGFAWMWVFLGMVVVLAGQFALEIIREKEIIKPSLPQGKILLLVLVIVVFVVIFGWQFILPEHIVQRFAAIALDETSTGARVYWSLEAFKMVREKPLFGLGGGAWEASYKHFQGYFYRSTQVHNDFAQTLMEAGYVGLFFFVGLWFAMLYLAYKNLKAIDDNLKNIQWVVVVAAISLGAHAFIDFDFALSAVTIVLFVLFGITVGIYRQHYSFKTWLKGVKRAVLPIMVFSALFILLQLVLPLTLTIASSNAGKGLEAVQDGNVEQAIYYFERAAFYDPFAANYRIDLANFYLQQGEEEKAEEYLLAAVARDRYNSEIYKRASQIYFNLGRIDEAVEFMELSRNSDRWNQETWNDLAQMYYYAGVLSVQDGNYEKAEGFFEKLSQVPEKISAKMASLGEWENSLWRRNRLTISPEIYLYAGVGNYFFDRAVVAEEYFNEAVKGNKSEALWWLALLKERQGQNEAAMELYEKAQAEHPEFENNFWAIRNIQDGWWNR